MKLTVLPTFYCKPYQFICSRTIATHTNVIYIFNNVEKVANVLILAHKPKKVHNMVTVFALAALIMTLETI